MTKARENETERQRHFQARLHMNKIALIGDGEGLYENDAIKVLDWCRENLTNQLGEPINDRELATLLLISYGMQTNPGWKPEGAKGAMGAVVGKFNRLLDAMSRQIERLANIDIKIIQQSAPDFDQEAWTTDSMEISSLLSTANLTGKGKSYDPDEDED
jgi:hypothetical protein